MTSTRLGNAPPRKVPPIARGQLRDGRVRATPRRRASALSLLRPYPLQTFKPLIRPAWFRQATFSPWEKEREPSSPALHRSRREGFLRRFSL